MPLRGMGFAVRPSGEFAHAGDLLSGPPESRQRAAPAKPPTLRVGALRCSKPRAAPNSLRYAPFRQAARSQSLKRAARAPWASALLGGLEGETPNSQQPSAHSLWSWLLLHSPSEPAEERRSSSPFAKRTSSTDSRRLSEQSVATRVRRAGLKAEHRRAARCEAKGRAVRGRLLCLLSCAHKKVGRPPGRTPGMGLAINPPPQQRTE